MESLYGFVHKHSRQWRFLQKIAIVSDCPISEADAACGVSGRKPQSSSEKGRDAFHELFTTYRQVGGDGSKFVKGTFSEFLLQFALGLFFYAVALFSAVALYLNFTLFS